ncbi:lumenal Hsp70 protein [Ophidiomyces ophidiicola]|nr:lumenal Hsp70 protein [Ophidiomyces ophidiicola]
MAPPGRRRSLGGPALFYLFSTVTLFAIIASFPNTISAAGTGVLGIDLGTEYIKAAVVKPGVPLEIVLTKDSKRKELSAVAFKPSRESGAAYPERFYGSDALALAPRFPNDVYFNLKSLLGIPIETGIQGSDGGQSNMAALYENRFPGIKLEPASDGRGSIGIRSRLLGEKEGKSPFLVEELLAMQLKQIKANAEEMGQKTGLEDAVITVPPFFSAEEKRSVQFAAELAGLNVLSLISDGMAVALNYATSRTFPNATNNEKPEHHVIFDMGAGSTTATVLKFQSRTVKDFGKWTRNFQEIHAVGVGWDKTLGGDALNQLIVNDMISKLSESGKLKDSTSIEQIKGHSKTMAKLWRGSEKIRQVLSANSETSATFESLYEEDVYFKYKISRAAFEGLAESHIKRISKPLLDALAVAKVTLAEVDSIILHGGAIRTPFVQKQLELLCGESKKVRTNVNADEAAALGAAFKGASLSRTFRVKEIQTYDIPAYGASIKFVTGGKERKQQAFLPTSQIGQEKITIIKNLKDFDFEFTQQFIRDNQTIDYPVSHTKTTNLTEALTGLKEKFGCPVENVTIWFGMQLNPITASPEITRGSASCEVEEIKKSVVEKAKEFLGFDSKKDQKPLQDDDSKQQQSESSSTSSSSTATDIPDSSASSHTKSATEQKPSPVDADDGNEEPPEAPRQVRIETMIIGFESTQLGIVRPSRDEMRRIKNRLTAFDASDFARVHRETTLNNLEAFIYRSSDLLNDVGFEKAMKTDAMDTLKTTIAEFSEWLAGDGADAPTKELKAKLDTLKSIVDPVLNRKAENEMRPVKIQGLQQNLSSAKMLLQVMENQIKAEESAFSASTSETPSPSGEAESTPSGPEPDASSNSSSASTSSASSVPTPSYSIYNPVDLSLLSKTHDEVSAWLDAKLKLQEKLAESDDPVLTSDDLETKLMELQRSLNKIMEKMARQGKPGAGSKKQGKKNGGQKKDQKTKEKTKPKTTTESKGGEAKKDDEKKGPKLNKDEL